MVHGGMAVITRRKITKLKHHDTAASAKPKSRTANAAAPIRRCHTLIDSKEKRILFTGVLYHRPDRLSNAVCDITQIAFNAIDR